jgi:hypothetical protein
MLKKLLPFLLLSNLLTSFVFADNAAVEKMAAKLTPVIGALEKPLRYNDAGPVAEYIAMEELKAKYPDAKYELVTGINYFLKKSPNTTTGELDVVVINRITKKAVMVIEVKSGHGATKARDQLKRFHANINKNAIGKFVLNGMPYDGSVFQGGNFETKTYGVGSGFDLKFGVSKADLHTLKSKMATLFGDFCKLNSYKLSKQAAH